MQSIASTMTMAMAYRRVSTLFIATTRTGTFQRTHIQRYQTPIILSRQLHSHQSQLWAHASTSVSPTHSTTTESEGSNSSVIIENMARKIREMAPDSTETYRAYSGGKELYLECAKQGAYLGEGGEIDMNNRAKFWYTECNRPPTFNAWAQVTILHMWTLITRFRAYPDKEKHDIWQQHFIDHFFYDAEERMLKDYKIKSNPLRSKYLKDLFVVYRGAIAAYDEAVARTRQPLSIDKVGTAEAEGDAVLAAAIWRNVFDASEDTDLAMLTVVTAYVRRIISGLDKLPDETVMEAGVVFGDPRRENTRLGLEEAKEV